MASAWQSINITPAGSSGKIPLQGAGENQVLNLRPDPKLRGIEGISLHAAGRDTHPAKIILIQRDRRTAESKVPGFKTRLGRHGNGKGNRKAYL